MPSNLHAVFRADASPTLGGGHIVRCLSLAEELAKSGWRCTFASTPDSTAMVAALAESHHQVVEIPLCATPEDEQAFLSDVFADGCDLLVVDHYLLTGAFERACRAWADRVMVIDDLADRSHDCDLLLDMTLDRRRADYIGLVSHDCKLLLGPSYALLRPQFAKERAKKSRSQRGKTAAQRIFVCFGLSDTNDLTSRTLRAIAARKITSRIDVVIGSKSPNLASVEHLVDELEEDITLHIDAIDVAALMARADFAIGAPGSMSWERCCLGLASMLIIIADNQKQNASALAQHGCAIVLGDHKEIDDDALSQGLNRLTTDPAYLHRMSAAASVVCDGKGALRCALALLPAVMTTAGGSITLRTIAAQDLQTTFAWQSDPSTRRYSHRTSSPSLDEHKAWFDSKLDSAEDLTLIIEENGEAAGVVRMDEYDDGKALLISILVDPARKRRGIASSALSLARRLRPNDLLRAEIHDDNNASLRLFQNAGYRYYAPGVYLNPPER